MDVEYEPAGPRPIKKLSKDVVNQIAAAEIIHRPANAIKELIENSLDAGSTSIKLTLKEGGLKLIQIADNGHGINKTDLPLLCTRYATSKLAKFEDLQSLVTYGFRGEALASISYVSHVEVVTKTREDGCGWRAHYMDGELVPAKPGAPADPRPAAANDGTMISAEDLFYNMPLRKRAFKSASDEYNRVLDVITKYAIHNPHSAWTCKKAGTAMADITTPAASTARDNIALLYGSALAKELLEIPPTTLVPEDKLGAKLKGWVSNANQSWAKKGGWIIFINNRLVDSSKIKKAVDSLYTTYLPKGASPWCYLSLEIDPTKVDVNVSPTKSEVHFLNEDEMIEAVVGAVQAVLAGANTSRSFTVQTLLPGTSGPRADTGTPSARKAAPNYKVRMDPTNRTLDSMISIPHPSQVGEFVESQAQVGESDERPSKRRAVVESERNIDEGDEEEESMPAPVASTSTAMWTKKMTDIPESECDFTSILALRQEAEKAGHQDVKDIMLKHAFVGIVDMHLGLSLIQHSTRLFLANHNTLAEEHFHQLGLRQFGAFDRLRLDPAPRLRDLINIAVEDEEADIRANGLEPDDIVETITILLLDKREMLDEYFSLSLTLSPEDESQGKVESLPLLLKGYTPDLDRLPHFLLCLGTRVEWDDEKGCFGSFLKELAHFYAPSQAQDDDEDPEQEDAEGQRDQHSRWQLEHVLWPSMRRYTAYSRESLTNGDLKQVANLPDLFRIFERC